MEFPLADTATCPCPAVVVVPFDGSAFGIYQLVPPSLEIPIDFMLGYFSLSAPPTRTIYDGLNSA
ncbi:hypothetical protein D3C80_1997000 [compost metagenome]